MLLSVSLVASTPVGKSCGCSSCGCNNNNNNNNNPSTGTAPIMGNPGMFGPDCTQSQLTTLWPDCGATSIFYQCIARNQFVTMQCAAGTFFSFEKQVCVGIGSGVTSPYCANFQQGATPPIWGDDGSSSCGCSSCGCSSCSTCNNA